MSTPENFLKKLNVVNCFECGRSLHMTCLCKGCADRAKKAEKFKTKKETA